MLAAMFSGRLAVQTDAEGWIIIDRNGRPFGTILNYLRDENCEIPESKKGLRELLVEAKYYCISDLVDICERVLAKRNPSTESGICRVPLITSQKEEHLLINSSNKPVVKLLINRHNNKYSYTQTSDDNLLKNIELFDKLSLRFSSRILFIKDVIGSNEICCWSFYQPFNGKKVGEVCCTSIVYATDKKHTKVEYPEARIYEETLNIILYEDKPAPDQDIVSVTARVSAMMSTAAGGAASSYTSDEEEERTGLYRLRKNKQNNPT